MLLCLSQERVQDVHRLSLFVSYFYHLRLVADQKEALLQSRVIVEDQTHVLQARVVDAKTPLLQNQAVLQARVVHEKTPLLQSQAVLQARLVDVKTPPAAEPNSASGPAAELSRRDAREGRSPRSAAPS